MYIICGRLEGLSHTMFQRFTYTVTGECMYVCETVGTIRTFSAAVLLIMLTKHFLGINPAACF